MSDDVLENAQARAHALLEIVGNILPSEVESAGALDDWTVYAPATIARCAYLLESIVALAHRRLDALILLRSLYEHVVTFAWIAADPPERMGRWVAYDFDEKRKMTEDCEAHGFTLPPTVDQEQFLRYKRAGVIAAPGVPERAEKADEYWSSATDFFDAAGKGSFRGQYALYFRHCSALAHPTTVGLNEVVSPSRPGWLQIGRPVPPSQGSAVGSAAMLFATLLLMAGAKLGWPAAVARDLNDAFERFPT